MRQLKVDPKFRDKIPALSAEEFERLEENILADGEVREPLVVWNDTIIDGHHRWQIIQKHPEIPYRVKDMAFADEWAAVDWMYSNQLGRRNLTDAQRTWTLGKLYEVRKSRHGAEAGGRGNQHTKVVSAQNGHLAKAPRICDEIAKEHNIGKETVKRAEHFVKGLTAADKVSPGFKDAVLSGEVKAPKATIAELRKMPEEETREAVEYIRQGKPEMVKPVPRPIPKKEEPKEAYNVQDFREELLALVRAFDQNIKSSLAVHPEMMETQEGKNAVLDMLSQADSVIDKYWREMK